MTDKLIDPITRDDERDLTVDHADDEVIKAAEVLAQRIIGWASDNIMEDNCRDWLGHVEPALDAFHRAMQGRAAPTKENNDDE